MNKVQLQGMIDLKKWYDSEVSGRDMCGTYDFCKYCDKSVQLPCASAYEKANAQPAEKQLIRRKKATVKPVVEQDSSLGKKFDYNKVMAKKASRKSLTFAEKYALSSDILKDRYAVLQKALTDTPKGAPKIKSRISKQCDTYRRNGEIIAKITIIGTSLRINLPLDCNAPEFNDGKTPHTDTSHKRVYEMVPFQFKVNSKLGLKRALALIELIK
ncbi:MAG: hypothetical protein NC037_02685 [Bacteroides sp.]|nr:hypothetical protein [Bacillota bacterium]MCM1393278.1 hypothetical protein [[Eubacterium] siraeum]MCM1455419.1 hypothetical protein [Bacteroides sp.]